MSGLFNRFGSGLGLLFSGPNDPNLDPSQNSAARRFAIMQAGLGMLGAPTGTPTLQALAMSAQYGQQQGMGMRGAYAQAAQDTARAQMRKRIGDAVQQGGPQALQQAWAAAVAAGDVNAANAIKDYIKSQQKEPEDDFKIVGGSMLQKQPDGTWKPIYEQPQGTKAPPMFSEDWFKGQERLLQLEKKYQRPSTAGSRTPRAYVDETTGQTRLGIFNPETGGFDPIEGAGPITGAGSENERKAAAFAQFIPEHVAFVDSLTGAPNRVEQAATNKGLREFTSDEQQQLKLAGSAMAEAWLRMTTGAAYNEREFQTAYELFVPQPGDKQGALEVKRRNRERLQTMLKNLSGRVGVPSTPKYSPNNPFINK